MYRRKGWGFTDPQQIAQCAKEGFVEKLRAQEGEGCHMWGSLAVNKVPSCTALARVSHVATFASMHGCMLTCMAVSRKVPDCS